MQPLKRIRQLYMYFYGKKKKISRYDFSFKKLGTGARCTKILKITINEKRIFAHKFLHMHSVSKHKQEM